MGSLPLAHNAQHLSSIIGASVSEAPSCGLNGRAVTIDIYRIYQELMKEGAFSKLRFTITAMEQEREGEIERLRKRQATTPHRPAKRSRLLEANLRSKTVSRPPKMTAQLGHFQLLTPRGNPKRVYVYSFAISRHFLCFFWLVAIFNSGVLRKRVKCCAARAIVRGYENNTYAATAPGIPHLRICPYKGSVATVQIQMPFQAIVRSWTLLPS